MFERNRWTYNSKLDPEVYLRISHLRVSNISSSILSVSERVHLRFTLSGYAADTPTARIVLDDGYVIWTEDLKILATAQTLVEKRVHVCLFLEMISVAVTETLVGCVYLCALIILRIIPNLCCLHPFLESTVFRHVFGTEV